ncbi:MAG: hypothetical protein COX40_00745 [Candidatus Omnitrophica bacterium CG23_combo_of_CG06-09_8_20_14_all_40_11]|nr:MAG: hypothetical protein COX40_00745 [Candidatus Omnitrophica bacterium CG23_combo_of_CG06-09_8_20_14_all_40_11]
MKILYKKGNSQDKRLFLTFDDGPNAYVTPRILDLLDEFKIKVAFFLVGRNIKRFPDIARQIDQRGHLIGNHSFSHQTLFALRSPEFQKIDAQKTEDELKILNIRQCSYFRPPYTFCSDSTLKALGSDYTIVGTNHYIYDHAIFSSRLIVSGILHSLKNRGSGIITLHEGACFFIAPTRIIIAEALQVLLPKLLSDGYEFCSLTDLDNSNNAVLPVVF